MKQHLYEPDPSTFRLLCLRPNSAHPDWIPGQIVEVHNGYYATKLVREGDCKWADKLKAEYR